MKIQNRNSLSHLIFNLKAKPDKFIIFIFLAREMPFQSAEILVAFSIKCLYPFDLLDFLLISVNSLNK